MATGDDNFDAFNIGGEWVDYDLLHIEVDSGTIDTVSNLAGGSVIITSGTITVLPEVVLTAGTADIGEIDITSGTIDLVTGVTTVDEITNVAAGTVTEVENIAAGTISLVDEITNLAAGTITEIENFAAGTISLVDEITNLAAGTVTQVENLAAGTLSMLHAGTVSMINAGTLDKVLGGTLNMINAGTLDKILAGTITRLEGGTIGLITTVTTVSSVTDVVEVTNLAAGTITELESGTVSMLNAGTIDKLLGGTVTVVEGGTIELVTDVTEVANLAAGTVTEVENLAAGTISVVDAVTSVTNIAGGTIINLSREHEFVELGEMFTISDYHTLDSGGTRLVTANLGGTAIHVWYALSAKGACKVRLIEGGTTTAAATLDNYNRKRSSDTVSDTAEWICGTVLDGGTVLLQEYIAGGVGPKPSGGGSKSDNGWVFRADKETCVEIVDMSASENDVSFKANWHEDA